MGLCNSGPARAAAAAPTADFESLLAPGGPLGDSEAVTFVVVAKQITRLNSGGWLWGKKKSGGPVEPLSKETKVV